MITWGIVANSHDASIAVAKTTNKGLTTRKKTELLWAALAKDFSGIPNDPHLNKDIIQYALNNYGYPNEVVWYERPFLKTLRQWRAGQGWLWQENNIRKYLEEHNLCNIPIRYVQHHYSHAAYAYYTQPHDDCAVICLDSIGEFETLTIWHGKNGKLQKIHSQGYPHSLGLFYSAMTQRMGLVPQRDEYLVSQWAKKGDPNRLSHLIRKEIINVDHEARNPQKIRMRVNLHKGCRWWRTELHTQKDMHDIAAATQAIFEYCVSILSIWAKVQAGSNNVALAGGGALNRDAIDKIRPQWDNVWVPPNPGDPGSAVGCILAHKNQHINNVDKVWNR